MGEHCNYNKIPDDNLENIVIVMASNNNGLNIDIVNNLLKDRKIPYLIFFESLKDWKNLILDLKKINKLYFQNIDINSEISDITNYGLNINNILYSNSFQILKYTLLIARAESMNISEIIITTDHISSSVYDMNNYIKNLVKLIKSGTNFNTEITLKVINNPINNKISNNINNIIKEDFNKKLVLLSGGLDSTVAGAIEQKLGHDLYFLQIFYGQVNRYQEKWCVEKLKNYFNIKNNLYSLKIDVIKQFGGSSLVKDGTIFNKSNRILEYIPFRNSIFLACALIFAELFNYNAIVLGAQSDDTLAPDCTKEYVKSFNDLLLNYKIKMPKIYAPLLDIGGKPEIISIGKLLNVPFKYTWSCNSFVSEKVAGFSAKACGTCADCETRFSAFKEINISDEIIYKTKPKLRTKWKGKQKGYIYYLNRIIYESTLKST